MQNKTQYALTHELQCIGNEHGKTAECQLIASVDPGYLILAIKTEQSALHLALIDLVHGIVASTKLVSEQVACWPIKASVILA